MQLKRNAAAHRFDTLAERLEKNIYGSSKGQIRLSLLLIDLEEYCSISTQKPLSVLDVGGGSGHLARHLARLGHPVLLCDASSAMLEKAALDSKPDLISSRIELLHADFLSPAYDFCDQFDLVLMHGSAEWMVDPDRAIHKACHSIKPGGLLSLLVFNRDRLHLKRGINGHLLHPEKHILKTKLTPPGARSPIDICSMFAQFPGTLVLQSGIRIFHGFFRQLDSQVLTTEQWIEQEKMYYRKPPFSSLGEHTHFIWQRQC